MGQTVVEKIIAHNIGRDSVKAGEIVTVNVDRVMMDDIMVSFIVDKFKEMHLTPCESKTIAAPGIAESPVSIECKVKQIIELGSHDMFLAEVTAVSVNPKYMDEKGKFHLNDIGLTAYSHGEYFELGKKIGSFGYSVKKHK